MILTVLGTRPEIIKMSLLIPMLDSEFEHEFMFTTQHYSREMVDVFFEEFKLRKPDYYLNVRSSNHALLRRTIKASLEKIKPDYVLVYGDVNTTLAGALAAKDVGSKVIHVEAGARSFDERMPEERNRVETDKASEVLFAISELTRRHLAREGITRNVFVVGLTSVDVCLRNRARALKTKILGELGVRKGEYTLLTAHRQENVDNVRTLAKIAGAFDGVGNVVFPIHPRTSKRLKENGLGLPSNIIHTPPLGYLDFLNLLANARVLASDSGGAIQEAITLKTPCLSIRDSTELWESIIAGNNILAGTEPMLIKYYIKMLRESDLAERMRAAPNPYGDGRASEKIIRHLEELGLG
ncbi:MAG: UDP-N-acetylglucosamine 2-epimerase (non-hydrolyzing) [Candidatus Micrarchaeota archaeon]